MEITEYAEHDATALAGLVAQGEVGAGELNALAARAIEAVNPELNFVAGPVDPVLEGDADGPFAGVPFLVKDLVLHLEGVPQTMGTRALANDVFVSPHSSELFRRFRAAGLTVVGRTTTPEFGYNASTEAVLYGPTRNPWNPDYSPAGSSGGSAAAVAAGVVPMAHANDGGGSIRLPASSCGLVGLKPSRGRTPLGPDYQMPLYGCGIEFVVSRTVRDSATLLDAVSGPEANSFIPLANPGTPFVEAVRSPYPRLRIALAPTGLEGTPEPDPEVRTLVSQAGTALESLGHEVVDIGALAFMAEQFHLANRRFWWSFCAAGVYGLAAQLGVEPNADMFEHATLVSAEAGRALSALDMEEAMMLASAISGQLGVALGAYDAVILPPSRHGALRLGVLDQNAPALSAEGFYDHLFGHIPYTAPFNVSGHPALAVPTGEVGGLPCGIQLVANAAREDILLSLAAQLEEALPWADRRPPVHAANLG